MNGKMTILACVTGFLLDCIFGDPVWMYHPIRVIGNLISVLEKGLRKLLCSRIPASEQRKKNKREVLAGGILWILTVSLSFLVPDICGAVSCRRKQEGLSEVKRGRLAGCKKGGIHDCRKRHREPYSRRCDESCGRDSGGEYFRRRDGSAFIPSDRWCTSWILIQSSEYDGFYAWIQK